MILIEASPSAYRSGLLALGKALDSSGGALRRFYTQQHPVSCRIDWHACSMFGCLLSQEGDMLLHRHMPAAPAPFLKAIAPDREGLVVAVECLFTWDLAGRLVC